MTTLQEFLSHPVDTLERALHLRKQIDRLNEALKEFFGPSPVSLGGLPADAPRKRGRPRKMKPASSGPVDQPSPGAAAAKSSKKPRTMSAAGRARIAAAQRARWAKQKGTHGPETAIVLERLKEKKKRGGLSAEGRARIVAAQKARWAKGKGKKSKS